MKVKISTKEKFHVLDIQEQLLSANMTEELNKLLLSILKKNINVVLKMSEVNEIEELAAINVVNIQQQFYDKNVSFVICEIKLTVEQSFEQLELLELMNTTPTESEAWDIIQMEEIERELLE